MQSLEQVVGVSAPVYVQGRELRASRPHWGNSQGQPAKISYTGLYWTVQYFLYQFKKGEHIGTLLWK
jgi:hypothetical protein